MNIKEPNRKKHSYTQHLNAPPETVFPLLCPVLEVEWAPGWMPEMVLSRSGVCEQDCVFVTPPETPSERQNSIWIVSKYDPANWALEMYKVTPERTISKLEISLAGESGNTTTANISYEITSIGAAGDEFMEEFTEDWYKAFMVDWEKAMNHYLTTGRMIS
jgi:hypothetical protein